MKPNIDKTITKLVLSAMDAAGVRDRSWNSQFKIAPARLASLRSGRSSLTDAELNRISTATGEPWQNLVLGLLGGDSELTSDTRELISGLHSLQQNAETEATMHARRPKNFVALRELLRKKSA
jgi:hypothetical protein